MKENELRVGNLLKRGGVLVTVDTTTIFGFSASAYQYEPIPITHEWLERFGFIKGRNYPGWVLLKDPEKGDYIKDNLIWQFPWGWSYEHIKSIHQLQNLYFALTGQELQLTTSDNTENSTDNS